MKILLQLFLVCALLITIKSNAQFVKTDFWWHGGVSADVNDPANWTDRNASTEPMTPGSMQSGNPYDIVRIGASWASEDLNGNGNLDPGEDLNGNNEIDDDDWASNDPGYGGYYNEEGRGIDLTVDPVLSEPYVSRTGDEYGGWWFVLNAPNILTLKDGAKLIMNRDNCNLRNGGRLEVQGTAATGEPSLILSKQFRIAENGSITEAKEHTSQLRINGTGYVQVNPALSGTGVAFLIGTSDAPGTMPRGEIIIEDNGRIEMLMDGTQELYLYFGNADPSVNQIIIRDQGELSLYGDPATMGLVGTDNTLNNANVVSLDELIEMELITNDQGGEIEVTGSGPTVITVTGIPSGIKNITKTALSCTLNQNYPNPFNSQTTIEYQIPENTYVSLGVFDINGRQVASLTNGIQQKGHHSIIFDGHNLPGGVYLYRLQTQEQTLYKRMSLFK